MIVEDESIIAFELKISLMKLGYDIVGIANNSSNAIDMALKEKPNLILMDINIKGSTDGIETAKQILKELNVPIIYLTAYANNDTIARASATNNSGYLLKPFVISKLKESIEKALD
jgi:DNA-binding NarL/FixJ family response regulator